MQFTRCTIRDVGKDNMREENGIKTLLLEDSFTVMVSLNLAAQTHSSAESAARLSVSTHAEQIREGEKNEELSLSLMQTGCLALSGIA